MRSRSNAQKMRKGKKVVKRKAKVTKECLLGKNDIILTKTKTRASFHKNGGISTDVDKSRAEVELLNKQVTSLGSFYSIGNVEVIDVGQLQTSEKLPEGGSLLKSGIKSSSCDVVLKVDANSEKLHLPSTPQLNPAESVSCPGLSRTFSSTPEKSNIERNIEIEGVSDTSRVSIIDVATKTRGGEAASDVSAEGKRMSKSGRKGSKRKTVVKESLKKEEKLLRLTQHQDEEELDKNRKRTSLPEEEESAPVSSDREDEDEEMFDTFEEVDIPEIVEYYEADNTAMEDADQSTLTEVSKSDVVQDGQRTDVSDLNVPPDVGVGMPPEKIQKEEIPFRVFKQKELEEYVIVFKAETSVPFLGKASIKVLCGSVDVSGFRISPSSRWHAIYSASFNNLTRLDVHLPTIPEGQEGEGETEILQMLDANDGDEAAAFLQDQGQFAAILLKRLECVAWEFASLLPTYSELMNDIQYESDLGRKYFHCFNNLGFFLCPNSDLYDSKSIKCLPGQEEATEEVLKVFAELRSPPVVVICGKKGTGKSTMCRHLINCFLNQTDSVCYLEADTGQTEFTPSCLISLHHVTEPLLGLPFVHQREAAKMFFFGSNETKSTPDLYLHMVSLVYQHYQQTFQSKPLIVNTNGWMSGLGGALLQGILHIVAPTHIISLQDPTDKHPFDFNNQASWLTDNSDQIPTLSSKLLDVQATPGHSSRLGAVQRRSMTLIGYFSPLLEQLRLDSKRLSLAAIPPYVVPWRSVAVHVCNADLSPNHILYALNAMVVGLCEVDPSEMYDIEGSSPEDGLPKILKKTPICRCLGIGLIRGIDPVAKNFYVITPVPHNQLRSVNALIKGTHTLPLSALRLGFRREEMPYVCTSFNQVAGYQAPKSRKYLQRNSSDRSFSKR